MYFANWILSYLPKPISSIYVQLGTCRPGVIKKAVINLFNAVCLASWKQCELIFRLGIYFFQRVRHQHYVAQHLKRVVYILFVTGQTHH